MNNIADSIRGIETPKIIQYLLSHGWSEQEQISNKASVWIKAASDEESFEVLLPLKRESPDFERRMIEVVETLQITERVSQTQILDDLTDIKQLAKKMEREVINFALSFPIQYGSEAPISHLGLILASLQNLINSIAQSLSVQGSVEGQNDERSIATEDELSSRISQDIAQEMELSAFGSFKGSFGLKLVSSPTPLLGNSLMLNSLNKFIDLVSVGGDTERLKQHLFILRSNSAKRYAGFLKSLKNAQADMYIDWGSTHDNYGGSARLSLGDTEDALSAMQDLKEESTKEFILSGRLIEGNIKTRHFIFENTQGETYTGKIAKDTINDVKQKYKMLPLDAKCTLLMKEVTINYLITDRVSIHHEICNLEFTGELREIKNQLDLFSQNVE